VSGRPLYHLLDPLWSRTPFPVSASFEAGTFQSIRTFRMSRRFLGREILPVYCYAVGDTLVDTGLPSLAGPIEEFARERRIARAVLTHHHEDHSGNAARLLKSGAEVVAGPLAAALLSRDLPIRFYQHFLWGKAEPCRAAAAGETVPIGRHEARVLSAPGHSEDQVAYFVAEEGWLFSGDAFLAEKVKVFRKDEDFSRIVSTIESFLTLDFDALLCAHRPRFTGGKAALAAKLEWLKEVEGTVRRSHEEGADVPEIVKRLGIGEAGRRYWITFGDVSPANMVRSVLFGPSRRRELTAILDAVRTS
jgi:glyoxylase-like metal-dependent hydrolase (beta-lactamase superfamily II)